MLSQLSLEDFKAWLTEQDGKVFRTGSIDSCPIAQYASARKGAPHWAAYDMIADHNGHIVFKNDWIRNTISVIDETNAGSISAKEVLALV